MTTEEAFVKVLQMHGIEHAFGIIGSAFMPISDIFPDAGITFWDVAHFGHFNVARCWVWSESRPKKKGRSNSFKYR